MEQRRLTKKEMIDFIIAAATNELFTGDSRNGAAPPITSKISSTKCFDMAPRRYGRVSLSYHLRDLLSEGLATLGQIEARKNKQQEYLGLADASSMSGLRKLIASGKGS